MAEGDLVQYKDISELKKELDGMKGRKDIPTRDLYDAVQKLTQTVTSILDIFSAATEQMKLEEHEFESESRKHEMIISKLDKLIDQNKTIAEGMVSIVEMVKEKIVEPVREKQDMSMPKEESLFKPAQAMPFMRAQQEWQPRPEPVQRTQPMMAPPQMATSSMPSPMPSDFGMQMPPMKPEPYPELPDLDFPEEPLNLEEEPKKKGLFGMFKK